MQFERNLVEFCTWARATRDVYGTERSVDVSRLRLTVVTTLLQKMTLKGSDRSSPGSVSSVLTRLDGTHSGDAQQ